MKLLVATRSEHKLGEIREILAPLGEIELVGLHEVDLPPDPPDDELEPFDTFEANALSKARWFAAHAGLPTVADDSGLEVDALDQAPGVFTKRFAPGEFEGAARDRANNRYLLERLQGVPAEARTARYVCVVAFVAAPAPGGQEETQGPTFRASVEGVIAEAPQGEGGFGYDPLFFVPALGCTFAEASSAQKHELSHRGKAFRAFAKYLGAQGAEGAT